MFIGLTFSPFDRRATYGQQDHERFEQAIGHEMSGRS